MASKCGRNGNDACVTIWSCFYEKTQGKLHFWRIFVEPGISKCDFGQKKWSKQKVLCDFFGPKWVLEHIRIVFESFACDFGPGRNENMTSRFLEKRGENTLFTISIIFLSALRWPKCGRNGVKSRYGPFRPVWVGRNDHWTKYLGLKKPLMLAEMTKTCF